MKPYKLLKAWRVYNQGEVVGIPDDQAEALAKAGVIGDKPIAATKADKDAGQK